MKLFNIKGIFFLFALLVTLDILVAFGASTVVKTAVSSMLNKNLDPKIRIESVRIHPVLLSVSVKGLSGFNPQDESERFFYAEQAILRLDLLALLRKKIWISQLILENIELEIVKDASGNLNVMNLSDVSHQAESPSKIDQLKDRLLKGRRDWFTELYDRIKSKTQKGADDKKTSGTKQTLETEIRQLPSGKIIEFKSLESTLFKINTIHLQGGKIILNNQGNKLPPIENIQIKLKGYRLKKNGVSEIDFFDVKGTLGGRKPGTFEAMMKTSFSSTHLKLEATNLDLLLFDPLFEDTLPFRFNDGFATILLDAMIQDHSLESYQEIRLTSHNLAPRNKVSLTSLTSGALLQALSKIDPLELKFRIGGTPEKPSFNELNKMALNLVKDQFPDVSISLKEQATEKFDNVKDKLSTLFKS